MATVFRQVPQLIVNRTGGSDLSVLGTFPWSLLSQGPAERTVAIIDEFDRNWTVGKVTFQSPT